MGLESISTCIAVFRRPVHFFADSSCTYAISSASLVDAGQDGQTVPVPIWFGLGWAGLGWSMDLILLYRRI